MKYIKLVLDDLNIKPNSEIKGCITVNYPGMYDGVVIKDRKSTRLNSSHT